MPRTKIEKIIFGVLMSFLMVYGMEIYNHALMAGGLDKSGFTMNMKEWVVLAAIVFAIENIYGGRLARTLAFRIMTPGEDKEAFVILSVQIFTICVMCPSMSLVAGIMFKELFHHGFYYFFATWIQTVAMNIPMAIVWQIAICGPLVRLINRKIVIPLEKNYTL